MSAYFSLPHELQMGTSVDHPSEEEFLCRKVNGVPPSLISHESGWCQVSHLIGVKHEPSPTSRCYCLPEALQVPR